MALIADLLIAAALLAAVVIGARRGLLRSLTGLVVVVLAFVLASWAADRLADPVAQKLSPLVERRIEQKLTQQESASAESVLADFGFIDRKIIGVVQRLSPLSRSRAGAARPLVQSGRSSHLPGGFSGGSQRPAKPP